MKISLHNLRTVLSSNRFSIPMQVEDVAEAEVEAKQVAEQEIRVLNSSNNNSLMTHNNNTQVEEVSIEAGGAKEVVEIGKGSHNIRFHVTIVESLGTCNLNVIRSKMT